MTADSADAGAGDSSGTPEDTAAATLGFLLAGLALASAFLPWTPVVAMYGVSGFPGGVFAALALGVLALRRHGVTDPRLPILAGLGFLGVVASAAAALLLADASGGAATSIGSGVYLALLVGVVGIGAAFADSRGLDRPAVVARVHGGITATAIGVGGLLFAFLLTYAVIGLFGALLPTALQNAASTVVFSVGLGIVAAAYALRQPAGLRYFDVRVLGRRDWIYVVGGLVGMFAVLVVGGVASQWLGLPSTEHGLIEQAQTDPGILLPLVPLSLLAIGPGEELLNRNVVQKHLYDAYTRYGAVLVATLVFTVIHVPAYAGSATPAALFVTLVRLFLVSLVLGAVYERTDNVVVAALVHGGFDAIQFGAAYVFITSGMG